MNWKDYITTKTFEQVELIRAIKILRDEGIERFSAKDIAERCGIASADFGGAFGALANPSGEFPPLVEKSLRKRIKTSEGGRRYAQLWKTNENIDWESLGSSLEAL